jgi:hypothetical protein
MGTAAIAFAVYIFFYREEHIVQEEQLPDGVVAI